MTAHNITTKRDIVKPLQYVGEGDTVTTATNYGTTPSSATFTLVGNNTEINPQPDVQHVDVNVLGSEDVIDAVKTQSLYAFSIRYQPINLNLWKFLWNASGGGTDSPDESLSFTYSFNLDGTEYFQHIRGARPTSGTLSVDRGVWECDMTFIAKDITIPNTTDGNSGTPVYQSSETTSAPITHDDGATNPFTWNSNSYPDRRFSTTVSRSMAVMAVNGNTDIEYCKAADRTITFSADIFAGTASQETDLLTDYEGKTERAFTYSFNSTGPITLTYANCVLTSYSFTPTAGSTDGIIESVGGRAESVTDLS